MKINIQTVKKHFLHMIQLFDEGEVKVDVDAIFFGGWLFASLAEYTII